MNPLKLNLRLIAEVLAGVRAGDLRSIAKFLAAILVFSAGVVIAALYTEYRQNEQDRAVAWLREFEDSNKRAIEKFKEFEEKIQNDPFTQLARERVHAFEPEQALAKLPVSETFKRTGTVEADVDLEAIAIRVRLAEEQAPARGLFLTPVEVVCAPDSQVTDEGLAHLAGLDSVTRIVCDDSRIGDAGLKHLKTLPNIQLVSLRNTQVTERGIYNLKKDLPPLTVIYFSSRQ
jgi:hypothetical protein